jgi:hypothetical protein
VLFVFAEFFISLLKCQTSSFVKRISWGGKLIADNRMANRPSASQANVVGKALFRFLAK